MDNTSVTKNAVSDNNSTQSSSFSQKPNLDTQIEELEIKLNELGFTKAESRAFANYKLYDGIRELFGERAGIHRKLTNLINMIFGSELLSLYLKTRENYGMRFKQRLRKRELRLVGI
ncbi:hypothetical protein J2T15_003501 [Paenibacillus harenae]|uniref:Uncharacterized protein n=1 Tax=Paenibacillus harenae TaxID=306543 RepID=A0ABT9U354_PAEHA|nr:hypothetical protein [Paenibacillus harenae]